MSILRLRNFRHFSYSMSVLGHVGLYFYLYFRHFWYNLAIFCISQATTHLRYILGIFRYSHYYRVSTTILGNLRQCCVFLTQWQGIFPIFIGYYMPIFAFFMAFSNPIRNFYKPFCLYSWFLDFSTRTLFFASNFHRILILSCNQLGLGCDCAALGNNRTFSTWHVFPRCNNKLYQFNTSLTIFCSIYSEPRSDRLWLSHS